MPQLRNVKDLQMASGNVQGGSSAAGVGGQFLAAPYLNPVEYTVLDSTANNPAIKGKVLVEDFANANPGPNFKQSATATQPLGRGKVGVVVVPGASTTNNQAVIVVEGPVMAYATSTANTNKAIAVGDPLTLDGAGNLTSSATNPGTAGTIVAHALQALAGGTGAATLILVDMGGY